MGANKWHGTCVIIYPGVQREGCMRVHDIIIKEKNEQPRTSGGKVFVFILSVVLAINVAMAFISKLQPLAAGITSFILILTVVGLAYLVVDRMITEYNYILTDKKIIFEKAVGKREKPVLEVNYRDILYLKPGRDEEVHGKVYYFLCNRKCGERYIIGFREKKKDCAVVFCPSQKMIKALQKRIG